MKRTANLILELCVPNKKTDTFTYENLEYQFNMLSATIEEEMWIL